MEEFYVITWDAKKEQVFEMPTGGAAIMRAGPNLLKLARKEQCLALLTQLRNKFKTDGQFYRVFPDGEVQYLHPKDGVYPEKVNAGRTAVGAKDRSIGKNTNPVAVCLNSQVIEPDRSLLLTSYPHCQLVSLSAADVHMHLFCLEMSSSDTWRSARHNSSSLQVVQ